jgi:hypothetical protein
MKTINRKLSEISGKVLDPMDMIRLRGGDEGGGMKCCQCACCYEGQPEGSNWENNRNENFNFGYYSPCGIPEWEAGCAYQQNNGSMFLMDWCGIIPGGGGGEQ